MNDDSVQLCVHDPGFEIDLYLTVTVVHMIRVWRGDVSVHKALESRQLKAHGPRRLVRKLRRWLNLSLLAAVKPAREAEETA